MEIEEDKPVEQSGIERELVLFDKDFLFYTQK